jgi:hypothetical protein
MSVTAGKKTLLWLDLAEKTLAYPAQVEHRSAAQIARRRPGPRPAGAPHNQNVMVIGGDAWILLPRQSELAQETLPGAALRVLRLADVDAPAGVVEVPMFAAAADLPWVTPNPDLITTGLHSFQKEYAAGVSAPLMLPASAAALPPPVEPLPQMYPVDRLLAGKVTYPENTPWQLRLETPGTWEGGDIFYRFYYGGGSEILPVGQSGGHFCLELRGSGKAVLYERDPALVNPWPQRYEFKYAEPSAGSRYVDTLSIIPHATNRTGFFGLSTQFFEGVFSGFGTLATLAGSSFGHIDKHLFRDVRTETGHYHTRAATGPGTIHMDQRQDLLTKFSIIRLRYPSLGDTESGVLVDAPFALDYPLPAGTPISLVIDAFLAPGTAVTGAIYTAATHAALATNGAGQFLTVANQRHYYVVLTLASVDGEQTPVLWGYKVRIAGQFRTNLRTPFPVDIEQLDLEGPDTDPSHEEGTVVARDIKNQASLLRQRDRIRAQVSIHDRVTGSLISVLMEGETFQPEGNWRGKPGHLYPSPAWRDYDNLRITGLWSRIADQLALKLENYGKDHLVSTNTQTIPWKVTDIIRDIFHNVGVDDDELDIPNLPIRLWTSLYYPIDHKDFILQAATDPAAAIRKLAWDYLGMVLVRDPNAGVPTSGTARGMWRLLRNPTPPYSNFLADFLVEKPAGSGPRLSHVDAGYGSYTTYVVDEHYRSWVKAPEVNHVVVYGKVPGSNARLMQTATNFDSLNNPNHPDYLGRLVQVIFPVDPTLNSQAAVDWAARIIYAAAAHAQKWFSLQAPLKLVRNALDPLQVRPRPLRINDLIRVGGPVTGLVPAIVRNCRIGYNSDLAEMMCLEGQFLVV